MALYPAVTVCVLLMFYFLSSAHAARPTASIMQRSLGSAVDAFGGSGTFNFKVSPQLSSLEELDFTMTLNGTSLIFETTSSIFKYKYEEFDSNIMEYRYYKSCITATPSKYGMIDHGISFRFEDATDRTIVYSFNLKEVPISFEQKVDLMFNEMKKEIKTLKDSNWFLSNKFNKANPQNGVRALGKFGANPYSMEKFFNNQEATATYGDASSDSFESSTYSLCMQFPIRTNFSRVEVDVSNVASGQCSSTVPVPFNLYIGAADLLMEYYYKSVGYNGGQTLYKYRLTNTVVPKQISTSTSVSNSQWTTVSANLVQPVATDILCFGVYTKGFSFSGQAFDKNCSYKLHGLRVF